MGARHIHSFFPFFRDTGPPSGCENKISKLEVEEFEKTEEIEVPDTYINGDGKIIKVSSMLLTMALYLLVYGNKKRHN